MKEKDFTVLFVIAIIGFIIWDIFKKKINLGSISNEESWEIVRDKTGRLVNIVIHRNVKEGKV